jgi:hypothetical protein
MKRIEGVRFDMRQAGLAFTEETQKNSQQLAKQFFLGKFCGAAAAPRTLSVTRT